MVNRYRTLTSETKTRITDMEVFKDAWDSQNIEQVWQEFFTSRSDEARNILMEHYLPLVKYTADRICAKLPDKVELDDLVSAGIFGLKDAIEAFDPERGVKFETYCTPRIRGSILDELRNMDWVPRLVRARSHRLEKATQTLEAQLGRLPNERELAEEMEMPMDEFHRLQRDANAIGLVSLNNKFNENEGEKDIREIDIIEDQRSQNPVVEAQKRDLKNLLTKGLTRAEKLIIILYYYEEMTMKEIGATLDLSESRVSQMHSSIIARLKAQMNSRKKEFAVST
jgi:RNA polymerase sigma factor for flagellar operon FliA